MARTATKKTLHAHGCKTCRTYYTDACDTPAVNGLCMMCRAGHEWTLLVNNRRPKDCCLLYARPVRKEEKEKYDLAGDSPWYICTECARVQTYQPGTSNDPRKKAKHVTT